MIIDISEQSFYDFYDKILNSENQERAWFFSESEESFEIIIPESSIIVKAIIEKKNIIPINDKMDKISFDDEIQRWRVEHLKNAIPFAKNNNKNDVKTKKKKTVKK